jgi:hypothetical protein
VKPLAIWIAVVAVVFGGYALVTSTVRGTDRVFVVVDTSFWMEGAAFDVPAELDRIDDRGHSEFALALTRDRGTALVHGWQERLTPGRIETFGPCSFDGIDQFPEAVEADERILLTSAQTACDTSVLTAWTVIEVDG